MKSIAFTDEYGDRHIVYARTEEAIDVIANWCDNENLHYEINPEDA